MKAEKTGRGFVCVTHRCYPPKEQEEDALLIQESSVVGEYDDALEKPGSSSLWVGEHHHLNREEVAELVIRMNHWLKVGRLSVGDVSLQDGGQKTEEPKTGEESYVVQIHFMGNWSDAMVYRGNKVIFPNIDTDAERLAMAKEYMKKSASGNGRPHRIIKRVETVVEGGMAVDG